MWYPVIDAYSVEIFFAHRKWTIRVGPELSGNISVFPTRMHGQQRPTSLWHVIRDMSGKFPARDLRAVRMHVTAPLLRLLLFFLIWIMFKSSNFTYKSSAQFNLTISSPFQLSELPDRDGFVIPSFFTVLRISKFRRLFLFWLNPIRSYCVFRTSHSILSTPSIL
jgi:hypothetical protein